MRSTHTFLIDFIRRRCKEDRSTAHIYARISVDGVRNEISLRETINVSDWDPKRQMVHSSGIQAKELNKYIDDVRFKIKLKYRMLLDKEALITAESVKQAYLGVLTISHLAGSDWFINPSTDLDILNFSIRLLVFSFCIYLYLLNSNVLFYYSLLVISNNSCNFCRNNFLSGSLV